MNTRNRSFELTILALLAGVNAVLELTLGNYLHVIKFPLVGSVMVGINVIIYAAAYAFVPKRGSIIMTGFITALLNLFFGGSFKPWSIVAIFLEAGLIELVIANMGLKLWSVIVASICANVFAILYSITVFCVILNHGVIESFVTIFGRTLGNPRLAHDFLVLAGAGVILIHVVDGLIFGLIAWKFSAFSIALSGRQPLVQEVE